MKTLLAFLVMTIGGCTVTGSFELPSKYGTVGITSDGKTANFGIRLPEGYSK